MEDTSPERLDRSRTRLEMAYQLRETAVLIFAAADKLAAYAVSVDANGDQVVDEAANLALKHAGKIRQHATVIRYVIANALDNADARENNEERKRRFMENLRNSLGGV